MVYESYKSSQPVTHIHAELETNLHHQGNLHDEGIASLQNVGFWLSSDAAEHARGFYSIFYLAFFFLYNMKPSFTSTQNNG